MFWVAKPAAAARGGLAWARVAAVPTDHWGACPLAAALCRARRALAVVTCDGLCGSGGCYWDLLYALAFLLDPGPHSHAHTPSGRVHGGGSVCQSLSSICACLAPPWDAVATILSRLAPRKRLVDSTGLPVSPPAPLDGGNTLPRRCDVERTCPAAGTGAVQMRTNTAKTEEALCFLPSAPHLPTPSLFARPKAAATPPSIAVSLPTRHVAAPPRHRRGHGGRTSVGSGRQCRRLDLYERKHVEEAVVAPRRERHRQAALGDERRVDCRNHLGCTPFRPRT